MALQKHNHARSDYVHAWLEGTYEIPGKLKQHQSNIGVISMSLKRRVTFKEGILYCFLQLFSFTNLDKGINPKLFMETDGH